MKKKIKFEFQAKLENLSIDLRTIMSSVIVPSLREILREVFEKTSKENLRDDNDDGRGPSLGTVFSQ